MFWRNVIANRNLEALIKDKQVLEIGGNNGDITVQLYDSFYHKVMEMIFPHKYMLIIQRKKL